MTRTTRLHKGRKKPRHLVIPDTQVKPGVPVDHIAALGRYIAAKKPDVIIHLGDHWDMPSLSMYEKKSSKFWDDPDRKYVADVKAGNYAMELLMQPIRAEEGYEPRLVFLMGNHEDRIRRAVEADPALEGALTTDHFDLDEWEVVPFLEPIEIDGVLYCHYFVNPQSLMKHVLAGTMDNRLNKLKRSFTQGHQQTRMHTSQYDAAGNELHGLVAGAFYQHNEDYLGPQGNHYWRGVVVKNEVENGAYDLMYISLEYLLREWAPKEYLPETRAKEIPEPPMPRGACPCCGSGAHNKHSQRTTRTEVQERRRCINCGTVFIASRRPRFVEPMQ